jgi:hypothetical protein
MRAVRLRQLVRSEIVSSIGAFQHSHGTGPLEVIAAEVRKSRVDAKASRNQGKLGSVGRMEEALVTMQFATENTQLERESETSRAEVDAAKQKSRPPEQRSRPAKLKSGPSEQK